jgi:uncharacterized membrane protein
MTESEGSHEKVSYWRRAHHDWKFWVGLTLMFVAMAIYILSYDLVFLPHG